MAERGKNPSGKMRARMEEEAQEREDRRHFAKRRPNGVGADEMNRQFVIEEAQNAIDALKGINEQFVSADERWPVAYVNVEEAHKIADAYESLDELWRYLPDVMAWTVGYDPGDGWQRSVYHGCLTEEQANTLAEAMNEQQGGEPGKPGRTFDVVLHTCRIIDMRKPDFGPEDL